jgi:hypothetical protein
LLGTVPQPGVPVSFADCQGFSRGLWQDVLGGCEGALAVAGQSPEIHMK